MRDRNLDLNKSTNLPSSDAGIEGGTNGAAAPVRALRRGYTTIPCDHSESDILGHGDTTESAPTERGGFLNRPQGWER